MNKRTVPNDREQTRALLVALQKTNKYRMEVRTLCSLYGSPNPLQFKVTDARCLITTASLSPTIMHVHAHVYVRLIALVSVLVHMYIFYFNLSFVLILVLYLFKT